MIHLIIGPSCAGKTSFTMNKFIKNRQFKQYKDILDICELDNCFLIGKYELDRRSKGTDTINRKDIKLIKDQVTKLLNKNKDIILDGDKITSHPFFDYIKDLNTDVKLYYIKCSPETSYERNVANNSVCKFKHLKAVCTKANNIYNDYKDYFDSICIETDNIKDFTDFGKDL